MMVCGLAWAAPGCSSTQMPESDGGGAQGGQGGQGGSGSDAGQTCGSLIAAYADAFVAARTCNPILTIVQCDQLASASLQCPDCPIHVNDTSRLDSIRAAFRARTDCPLAPCPAILCVNPGTSGACVANDSGGAGSCVDVR